MNFKTSILSILLLISTMHVFAQSREAGIMVGLMGYRGDLDSKMYDLTYVDPGIGVLYRRSYSNHWVFKAGLSYGRIEASDVNAEDAWSRNRNLNFRTGILEATGQFEFNFLPYQTASPFTSWSPYIMAGFTIFRFNPKGNLNDEWIDLQPLGTEGQGIAGSSKKLYNRTALAFTFGGGIKLRISRRFGCAIETGVRQTYTDYLDDVSTEYFDPLVIRKEYGRTAEALSDRSLEKAPGGNVGRQRGDRNRRDFYVFTGIQITYTLSKKYIDNCRPFRIKLW